jgi:uncharacterized damage-inducible protein DinB
MNKLETAKYLLGFMMNNILPVLEIAISMIPEDKMDYKPNTKLNTIKWLSYHSLNGPYVYLKGVEHTILTSEIYSSFDLYLKDISSSKQLVDYSLRLKTYVEKFQKDLTEDDVKKIVTFEIWEPHWSQTGFEAIQTSIEEMIHHRGQLCTYLRLLDIDPPFLYSYL